MSVTGIESVLSQLRGTASAAGTQLTSLKGSAAPQETGEASFASELKRSLDKVSDTQESANVKAQQFELGTPNVSLNDVMVDLQKANIGFQMSLQVRNKLVTAYQDIMNMQA